MGRSLIFITFPCIEGVFSPESCDYSGVALSDCQGFGGEWKLGLVSGDRRAFDIQHQPRQRCTGFLVGEL